jgi:hypothetical protein
VTNFPNKNTGESKHAAPRPTSKYPYTQSSKPEYVKHVQYSQQEEEEEEIG